MGYFSNSTDGISYEEFYCYNCVNWRGGTCPVWQLHCDWNYKAANGDRAPEDSAERAKFVALNSFIPRDPKIGNEECKMFVRVEKLAGK